MTDALRRFRWGAREFLWPRRCAGCGIRDTWLCDACVLDPAPWSPEWCVRCGVPVAYGGCQCNEIPAAIDAARSIGWHEGWIRSAVQLLKYSNERARAAPLGTMMAEAIQDLPRPDFVVPVPLHPRRERGRGFNQSHELAAGIAFETEFILDAELVRRSIDTTPQVGLPRHLRHQNVRGVFETADSRGLRGASVLLVDDVFTTGSTLAELARVVKRAGARRVDVVTVARAADRHPG